MSDALAGTIIRPKCHRTWRTYERPDCENMVRGMWRHLNGDWDDWMNCSMCGAMTAQQQRMSQGLEMA